MVVEVDVVVVEVICEGWGSLMQVADLALCTEYQDFQQFPSMERPSQMVTARANQAMEAWEQHVGPPSEGEFTHNLEHPQTTTAHQQGGGRASLLL